MSFSEASCATWARGGHMGMGRVSPWDGEKLVTAMAKGHLSQGPYGSVYKGVASLLYSAAG